MKKVNLILLGLGMLISSASIKAAEHLMLFPTRVVFEKNVRAIQVDLTNSGDEVATYRITLENKRMTELGQFVPAEPLLPGELTAEKIIQYSPRQVELAPGAGQTIRIILRKPADLAPGEYRSHMVFSKLPNAKTKSVNGVEEKPTAGIGIAITPLIGASIPVIVINGDTTSTLDLKDLKFSKAKPNEPAILEARMMRGGNRSVYGDFAVTYTPKGGSEEEVAAVKGVAVYSPNPSRLVKLAIQTKSNKPMTTGKLNIKFSESRDAGGKLLSEASLEIP